MTHNDLVERVARALFQAEGHVHDDDHRMFEPVKWEELDDEDYQCVRDGYRQQARAALAAVYEVMKEPTPEMRREGSALKVNVFTGSVYDLGRVAANDENPGDVGTIFRAMLSASPLNPENV